MTTTIILIRHAQSVWNAAGRWQGQADPELSPLGRQQARLVADRLSHWPISHVYCSDLQRATDTATAIADAHQLAPVIDPVWRERAIGAWEGLTLAEIHARFPEEASRIEAGPVSPPGAEPIDTLYQRAAAALSGVIDRHHNDTVVVVSHSGTIHAVLSTAIGLPPDSLGTLSVRGHTGLSILEAGPRHRRLVLLNDTSHLGQSKPG